MKRLSAIILACALAASVQAAQNDDAWFAWAAEGIAAHVYAWLEVVGLRVAPAKVSSGVLNGKLYVVGSAGGGTNLFVWDGSAWTQGPAVPFAINAQGGATLGGKFYVAGGGSVHNANGTNFISFDGTNWTWEPAIPLVNSGWGARVVSGCPLVTFRNSIYRWGGTDWISGEYTNCLRFDGTNWTEVSGMPVKIFGMAGVVFRNNLYSIGAGNNGANTNYFFIYNGTNWFSLPALGAYGGGGMGAATNNLDRIMMLKQVHSGTAYTNIFSYDGTNWSEMAGCLEAHGGGGSGEFDMQDGVENYAGGVYILGGSVTNISSYQ